jgi:hypothetical protein
MIQILGKSKAVKRFAKVFLEVYNGKYIIYIDSKLQR